MPPCKESSPCEVCTLKQQVERLRELVLDCQRTLAAWIVPDSGITDAAVLDTLLELLDGQRSRKALADTAPDKETKDE